MAKHKLEKIVYLSSSHWDREWYLDFQTFRFRLVKVLNQVIEVLENDPDFSRFTMDGQTSMLEDYFKIMPENKARVEKLINEGRIIAGPWYTMPDENLTSGESLIANLTLGHKLAREFGSREPMKYGYVCDMFGHIAQLPQILSGFGINGALLGRGTNDYNTQAHFIWRSPNGSQVTAFKVPEECGYGTFWREVLESYLDGTDPDVERLMQRSIKYVKNEADRTTLPYVMIMDGMDHEPIHPIATKICQRLREEFQCEVEITSPDTLLPLLNSCIEALEVRAGELQETAKELVEHNKVITNSLSSRYDIKKLNTITESLIERKALPLAALAAIINKPVPQSYIDLAQKYLLQNHAHDSICGCSLDQVSDDMTYRYNQAQMIAKGVIEEASANLFEIKPAPRLDQDIKLTLINTEPHELSQVIEVDVIFPAEYPAYYCEEILTEPVNSFHIHDCIGNLIPYQILDVTKGELVSIPEQNYRTPGDIYKLSFSAVIPPMGMSEYKILPSTKPVRNVGSLLTGNLSGENDHIKLEINPNGSLNITDKVTGRHYQDLMYFKDYGETGDGWFHRPPVGNPVQLDSGSSVDISIITDGSELCTFRIIKYLSISKKMEYTRHKTFRSNDKELVKLVCDIRLTKTARWVDAEITVVNTAKDHKMSVNFPTNTESPCYEADQAFCFVKRETGDRKETHDWKEYGKAQKPFRQIVLKENLDKEGLAIISKHGTHECAVHSDSKSTVEITLFRSFSKVFLTTGEPGGQLQGDLSFAFRIIPLNRQISRGALIKIRDSFTSPPIFYSSAASPDYTPKSKAGYIELDTENITLSALKPSANAGFVCLRLVNYSDKEETGEVKLNFDFKNVYEADLKEEVGAELDCDKIGFSCKLKAFEIKTYLIKL